MPMLIVDARVKPAHDAEYVATLAPKEKRPAARPGV
jgi:hypothetical protein